MHLDMRASKGYTQELEKLNQDDRGLTLKINFKTPITKKRAFGFRIFKTQVSLSSNRKRTNDEI